MQTEQGSMLRSLRAVQEFLDRHDAKLPGVGQTGARQRLADAITALEGHVAEQSGNDLAAQGATKTQRALRAVLIRRHMKPISRIAKADLPRTPSLAPLRMPRGKPTIERLCAAADGMAKAAAPHTGVFLAAGLPVDFIARLEQAADALVVSVSDRIQSRGERKGATRGLKAKLTAGRQIVGMLDAFVSNALEDDPALLESWGHVKHVPKTRGRSATATPAPEPAPAPALTVSTGTTAAPALEAPVAPAPDTAAA
jgi:hypothetical protein